MKWEDERVFLFCFLESANIYVLPLTVKLLLEVRGKHYRRHRSLSMIGMGALSFTTPYVQLFRKMKIEHRSPPPLHYKLIGERRGGKL